MVEHVKLIAYKSVVGVGHVTFVKLIDLVHHNGVTNDNTVTVGALAVIFG